MGIVNFQYHLDLCKRKKQKGGGVEKEGGN